MTTRLVAFPTRAAAPLGLVPAGLSLRRALDEDVPLLREIYADSRALELSAMPWPADTRCAFLASQFALQHTHYVTQFQDAWFGVIEKEHRAVGRLYLDQRHDAWHVVDISLLASWWGRGIGTAILRTLIARAVELRLDVSLQVSLHNVRAHALYQRLGFVEEHRSDTHVAMRRIS